MIRPQNVSCLLVQRSMSFVSPCGLTDAEIRWQTLATYCRVGVLENNESSNFLAIVVCGAVLSICHITKTIARLFAVGGSLFLQNLVAIVEFLVAC